MDDEERTIRHDMLTEIGLCYRELRKCTLRYGRNHPDSTQTEFLIKLRSFQNLRNSTRYREALSKIDTAGLERYRNMVRDFLSLLKEKNIRNFSPAYVTMRDHEEEMIALNEERILAISTLERDGEVDFNLLRERLTYADERLPKEIKFDAIGPCFMRALMAVAETFVGRNLCIDELGKLRSKFLSGSDPIVDENKGYNVERPKDVIEETLIILGAGRNLKISIENTKIESKVASGSLRKIPSPLHWQEGDCVGNFRWDGYYGLGNSNASISETRYVYIERLID